MPNEQLRFDDISGSPSIEIVHEPVVILENDPLEERRRRLAKERLGEDVAYVPVVGYVALSKVAEIVPEPESPNLQ